MSAPEIVRGTTLSGPIVVTNWSPTNGYTSTWKYTGTKAEIEALSATFFIYEWTISNNGPVYTLDVSTPTDNGGGGGGAEPEPIVTWDLQANIVDKNILDSDIEFIKMLHPVHIKELKDAVRNPPRQNTLPILTVNGVTSSQLDDAYKTWLLLMMGAKSIPTNLPILKKQFTVSNQYIIENSINNVNKIYSRSSLISEENVPFTIQGCIPNPTTTQIKSPLSPSIILNYGWKKLYPTINRVAEVKYQVSQEWHYNLWSETLYGAPI